MSDLTYTDFLADLGVGGAHPGSLRLTKNIINTLDITDTSTVLDVGCGTGQSAYYIANRYGCQTYALDKNSTMIQKAKSRLMNNQSLPLTFLQGNAEILPFSDNTFDFIFSESVTSFTNYELSLNEYARVLKPSGTLILVEMTKRQHLSEQEIAEIKDFYGMTTIFAEEEWRDNLTKVGFTTINTEDIPLTNEPTQMEFNYSEDLTTEHFDVMNKHHFLTEKYVTKLSAKVYYCKFS
ncbi:ubiquinone/menaquinone biosynthesis C-methylase UbiE [Salirhabdus euzebyi]|uniref:Ubiquinone/menaquinone biosynthesis C-methylase UbiE n=1 Tax=Salirhabdus euzebyi TaxID=394506 RepID=A0A841Q5S1_9BACI|nr:methyltransferase domain-containing protein [Salirhabdus euzebyi]MBB6453756.1 ubiquinone/menaquinone biosynthesis C-methylase UbiE [Salirhabdus euzebyi]